MKHILLFGLLFSLVLFGGCDSENFDLDAKRNAGFVPVISELNPAIYIQGQLDESFIKFNVSVEDDAVIDEAYIEVSFNGVNERLRVRDIASFPVSLTFTAMEIIDDLDLSVDDLEGGDFFLFEIVTRTGEIISRSSASVSILIACPSDIAGVYTLEAKGTGGSGAGESKKWKPSIETVEIISKDGGVTYTIEPALGGLMVDFYSNYGAEIVKGEFQDICGEIKNAVVHDGWQPVPTYSGTIDEETGVITISFEIDWDDDVKDKAIMTLTPIE